MSVVVSRAASRLALAAVLFVVVAGSVGSKWGLPYIWHPDEKVSLADDLIERRSFDPQYFINPSLHVYAVTGIVWVTEQFLPGRMQWGTRAITALTDPANPNRPIQMAATMAARGFSALCAGLSVWFLWRGLRRRTGDWPAAFAAAALGASLGLMNVAHFATPEATLVLLIVLALNASVTLAETGTRRAAIVAGLWFGLACSTKYTAILLAAPLGWALLLGAALTAPPSAGAGRWAARVAALGAVAFPIGILAFFATTPYALINWSSFVTDGLIFTWHTGAPANSLVGARRSWGLYAVHLANGFSWPLWLMAVGACLWWALGSPRERRDRVALSVHAIWIAVFWGFLGLSPHNALRFIMPVAPSVAVFAGWGAALLWHLPAGPALRRAARVTVGLVLLYAAAYSARGAYWFANDTRYEAGAWLKRHARWDVDVTYFAVESYLPFFDRPRFGLTYRGEIYRGREHDANFQQWQQALFAGMNDVIVDTSFFYQRFFDEPDVWPGRMEMYQRLMNGTDPAGYRLVASFEQRDPWWLHPNMELVAPRIVIFAKPGQTRD